MTSQLSVTSRYLLQKTTRSRCPSCHKLCELLCTDEEILKALRHHPWFYICWHCKRVYELGINVRINPVLAERRIRLNELERLSRWLISQKDVTLTKALAPYIVERLTAITEETK